MRFRAGMALLLVVGILALLGLLSAAFLTLARAERTASRHRAEAARARLLARAGMEDAFARIRSGQDGGYGGEDWDGSGDLSAFERSQEVLGPGSLDRGTCPARMALRPSYFVRGAGGRPALEPGPGRLLRGLSARWPEAGAHALRVTDLNARIHVNGGDLSPPGAADPSPGGPNGFLRRLLDNLEAVVDGTPAPTLGVEILSARPAGGYSDLEDLRAVLGPDRFFRFSPFLTPDAWVDPKVLRPAPLEDRPDRWRNIDPIHRDGLGASSGTGAPDSPWSRILPSSGSPIDTTAYPVSWERDFIYSAAQMRPGPLSREPRAPLSLNAASEEALAAAFLGLRGTGLEVWDGSAGWDGGFGFYNCVANPTDPISITPWSDYLYPSPGTEDTPWIRTRADYGASYGTPGRPWYGPRSYAPATWPSVGHGGRPLPCPAPLGRLRTCAPIGRRQAMAVAREARERIARAGPFRTWEDFRRFVRALPEWEDLDEDGILDGATYTVPMGVLSFPRRRYEREDRDSDGRLRREVFRAIAGDWASGGPAWEDPGLPKSSLAPARVPGLTFIQKDVLLAMANPNADLNDANPDEVLFKEVDKTDLLDHTTELSLDPMGLFEIESEGRGPRASRSLRVRVRAFRIHRDTTQADFLRGSAEGPAAPYPLSGGLPLLTRPEPETLARGSESDGQVGLGLVGSLPGPDETLRGDLFQTPDAEATGDAAEPDLEGPGRVFPDGIYSERDASLKYRLEGNLPEVAVGNFPPVPDAFVFYLAFWTKVNWLPEASPRAHALLSFSPAVAATPRINSMDVPAYSTPLSAVPSMPAGLYFVPARNNTWQGVPGLYYHDTTSARGRGWASRSLLWGTVHSLYASDTLNRSGIPALGTTPPGATPPGRLQGRRWRFIAAMGKAPWSVIDGEVSLLMLGRSPAASGGGGLRRGFGGGYLQKALLLNHLNDPSDPNHIRFGEVAGAPNMNYTADATFAGVRVGGRAVANNGSDGSLQVAAYRRFFGSPTGPAGLGRYLKEDGALLRSGPLPDGARPVRVTWTALLPDLWTDPPGASPENDRCGGPVGPNGLRDVRIDLELWSDAARVAAYADPGAANGAPALPGPLHWRARFVNEWDPAIRANEALDVSPFLDDVTVSYETEGGPGILRWEE